MIISHLWSIEADPTDYPKIPLEQHLVTKVLQSVHFKTKTFKDTEIKIIQEKTTENKD